jgi:hypothetical protein
MNNKRKKKLSGKKKRRKTIGSDWAEIHGVNDPRMDDGGFHLPADLNPIALPFRP